MGSRFHPSNGSSIRVDPLLQAGAAVALLGGSGVLLPQLVCALTPKGAPPAALKGVLVEVGSGWEWVMGYSMRSVGPGGKLGPTGLVM